jgi:uncharacterized protein
MRIAFLLAGVFFVLLAVIGALLPVMPSTIFLILAAACFARSSPRLEAWMLEHPVLGPPIRRWRERGAIAPGAKLMALFGMAAGYAILLFAYQPSWYVAAAVLLFLAASAGYVVSRPDE